MTIKVAMIDLIMERRALLALSDSDQMLEMSDEDFSALETRIMDIDDMINGRYNRAVKAIDALNASKV